MARTVPVASAPRMVMLAIAIITLVFILITLNAMRMRDEVAQKNTVPDTEAHLSTADTSALKDTDSDSDGLFDWEETLWNTDPRNPDSDGDGKKDGDEVQTGGNPGEKGTGNLAYDSMGATSTRPVTTTDLVANELMGSLLSSMQAGKQLTAENKQKVLDDALSKARESVAVPKYGGENLLLVEPSLDTWRAYAITFTTLLEQSQGTSNDEVAILFEMAQGNRTQALSDLETVVRHYSDFTLSLQKIAVPRDMAPLHISLVQAFLAYTTTLDGISDFDKDPMRATLALNMLGPARTNAENRAKGIRVYLGEVGVMPKQSFGTSTPTPEVGAKVN
jgi:hypothetical protein